MSAPVPQASLHTDAFKPSLHVLEALSLQGMATQPPRQALNMLWGPALRVGFINQPVQCPDEEFAAGFGDGHLETGYNPMLEGWHLAKEVQGS